VYIRTIDACCSHVDNKASLNSELESFVENLETDPSFPFGGESHYYAKSAAPDDPRRCKENVVKSFHSDVREREREKAWPHSQ
jgi:hypothetical protein